MTRVMANTKSDTTPKLKVKTKILNHKRVAALANSLDWRDSPAMVKIKMTANQVAVTWGHTYTAPRGGYHLAKPMATAAMRTNELV